MDRRTAVKSLALASVSTLFLTGCRDKNVVEFLFDGQLKLNQKHLDYLAAISENFLPVSDLSESLRSPSAYIMTMINDTYPTEEIAKFAEGFEQYKELMNQSRLKIKSAGQADIIMAVEATLEAEEPQKELVDFINSVRSLSIRNFTSSEYFMVNHREYQMIPPKYNPCITV